MRIGCLKMLCGFLCIIGCTPSSHSGQSSKEVFVIGEVDSFTGADATFGEATHRGVKLAFDQLNQAGGILGVHVKLVKADAQGKPDEAARAAASLMDREHVVALITGAGSSNAMAIAPLAQQRKVPLIGTAVTNLHFTETGEYIYRVCFTDVFQGKMLAQFAYKKCGLRSVALLKDMRTEYSIGLAAVFEKAFVALGGKILIDQSYATGDMDFRGQLTAIRSHVPDALFIPGYYTDVSLIARQARELGIKSQLLGADGWDSPKLFEIAQKAVTGSYISSFYSAHQPTALIQKFVADFNQVYHRAPDGSAAMGYEAAQFLIAALKKATQPQELFQVQSLIQKIKRIEILSGTFELDAHRNPIRPLVILKIAPTGVFDYFDSMLP